MSDDEEDDDDDDDDDDDTICTRPVVNCMTRGRAPPAEGSMNLKIFSLFFYSFDIILMRPKPDHELFPCLDVRVCMCYTHCIVSVFVCVCVCMCCLLYTSPSPRD